MENCLSDFPPDQFAITAHCTCGHSDQIDYRLLPPDTFVSSLRPKLVCRICGRRDPNTLGGCGWIQVFSRLMTASDTERPLSISTSHHQSHTDNYRTFLTAVSAANTHCGRSSIDRSPENKWLQAENDLSSGNALTSRTSARNDGCRRGPVDRPGRIPNLDRLASLRR